MAMRGPWPGLRGRSCKLCRIVWRARFPDQSILCVTASRVACFLGSGLKPGFSGFHIYTGIPKTKLCGRFVAYCFPIAEEEHPNATAVGFWQDD